MKLQLSGTLQKEWVRLGSEAYYGDTRHLNVFKEFGRHGPGIAWAMLKQFHDLRAAMKACGIGAPAPAVKY
jgi:hypothetical protein